MSMVRGVSSIRQPPATPANTAYQPPQRQPVFSRAGTVSDSIGDISPAFVFILSGHLVRMVAVLRVPAADNTVINCFLNGVSFLVITIPAGEVMAQEVIDQPFTITDQLTVSVLSGGTNGEDLTVIGDPR